MFKMTLDEMLAKIRAAGLGDIEEVQTESRVIELRGLIRRARKIGEPEYDRKAEKMEAELDAIMARFE